MAYPRSNINDKSVIVPPKNCDTCYDCSNHCAEKVKEEDIYSVALDKWFKEFQFNNLNSEIISLDNSLNRINTNVIYSKINIPVTNCASHDGVAVNYNLCKDRFFSDNKILKKDEFLYAPMGTSIPDKFNTLIHAEQCILKNDGTIKILRMPKEYQSIKLKGKYIAKDEMLLEKRQVLTPATLSLLQYSGHTEVEVYKKPVVTIIPIGNDLKQAGEFPEAGEYIDCNSIYISSIVKELGGLSKTTKIIKDNEESISNIINDEINKCDILILIGGVGKGEKNYGDYTLNAIQKKGKITSYGIKLGPGGQNLVLANIDNTPVIGMPGPPHACLIMTEYFIPQILEKYLGYNLNKKPVVKGILEHDFPSRGGGENIWRPRVNVKHIDDKYYVSLIKNMGETVENFITTNGTLEVTDDHNNYKKNCIVDVTLLKDF